MSAVPPFDGASGAGVDGPIRLDIPAVARYLTTARLVAASAGADAGLSVDDLEDLRLGVDELAAVLIARATGAARLVLAVTIDDHRVVVVGSLDGDVDPEPDPADQLSERIVAAVADSYELTDRAFRLEKSASTRDG